MSKRTLLAATLSVTISIALAGGSAAVTRPTGKLLICSNRADRANLDVDNRDLYVVNADGTGAVRLTDAPGGHCDAEWSPDGKRIVFTSYRDHPEDSSVWNGEIYVMNADRSHVTRLTANEVDDISPTWSPDGRRIAFTRSLDATTEGLYVMNADGSGVTKLSTGNPHNTGPSWSPDGTRIAFHSWPEVGPAYGGIYLIDPDGSDLVELTHPPAYSGDFFPAWSPGGTRIAFWRGVDVHVVNADGTGETMLVDTANLAGWGRLTWSPDGRWIAFGNEFLGSVDVFVVNADGSGETSLIWGRAYEWPLDWRAAAWPGDCTIVGTPGKDMLRGTGGGDVICGLAGNDLLKGLGGWDVLRGGPGDDRLWGGGGNDRLEGGPGRDYAHGGTGSDVCKAETKRLC